MHGRKNIKLHKDSEFSLFWHTSFKISTCQHITQMSVKGLHEFNIVLLEVC